MKKLSLVGVLVVVGALGWRAWHRDAPDPKLIFDRFWIDHEPRDGKENFQALMIRGERPWGHFGVQTWWRGQWEAFHYHVLPNSDGQLELLFPATNENERVTVRAVECSEQGFDYCLELSGSSRGVRRYFSKREWRGELAAVAAEWR